jgi:hypothetical protein
MLSTPAPSSPSPARIAFANTALDRVWRRGWLDRPPLEPEALVARARAKTGHTDFGGDRFGGDGGWRTRLDVLVEGLHTTAALTALGRTIAHGQLVAALANRLRLQALWRRHPEILDRPVPAPVIVLGQMRSGTTRMQRLLACDPRFGHTRFFESWNPVPARIGGSDDRWRRGWLALRAARFLCPEFDAIHPAATGQADEEIGFHNISIFGSAIEAQWRVPGFAAHAEAADAVPVYREFRAMLQTVAWLRREPRARPWIVKLPQMTQDLPAVLSVFPDARLVCLDRDSAALVASAASLVHSQMRLQSDAVDPRWIGREWLRKVALRRRRTADALSAGDVPRVLVSYEAIGADWRGEMARVYAMLGLPLLPAIEARMARYLARAHPRAGLHRYHLADFGLTREDVDRALSPAPPVLHPVFRAMLEG